MAINAHSTQQDIVGQYLDNLGYDHADSTVSCKLFIQACRALLVLHPSNWSQSSVNMTFDPQLWQRQLDAAQQWLAANSSTVSGSVRHLAFGDFR
jgi:hypothetical protein